MKPQTNLDCDYSSYLEYLQTYSVDILHREIYLYNYIDEDSTVTFIKNINFLNNISTDPILIYNQSMGGDMSLGLGIYDAIKSSVSQTIMITCGMTASMGTVIAQAPDIKLIYPSTVFLIHEGYISFEETETKTAVSNIKSAKWYLQKLYDIYYSSCKSGVYFKDKNEKQVKSFLRKTLERKSDWYLDADEIIKYGLADHILTSDINSVISNIENIKK